MTQTTSIYYDTQDPQNPGWAWRHAGASGPIDGDLGEDASLVEVLDQVCGSDVPLSFADPSLWRPIQGAKGCDLTKEHPMDLCGGSGWIAAQEKACAQHGGRDAQEPPQAKETSDG